MNRDWLSELQEELDRFAEERDWGKYHTPQNLAALIASEAGELLSLFRWGQNAVGNQKEEVEQELADVFLGVLRFADITGIELEQISRKKLQLNAENYPPESDSAPDRRSPL